jgi:hypothetical protein
METEIDDLSTTKRAIENDEGCMDDLPLPFSVHPEAG